MTSDEARLEALVQSRGQSSNIIHERVVAAIGADLPALRKDVRILDVGCGTGAFLSRLNSLGFKNIAGCDGYEYDEMRASGVAFKKADLNSELPFANGSFDIVTAIEVIEHLENPRRLVREVNRVLKPGGLAIVSTPNNECVTSLLSLLVRGYFSAFADTCYPAHITPLLQIDLRRMMTEAQFGEIKFFWTEQGRLPGTSLHWQSVLPGVFGGKRFSDNVIVRGRKTQ